MPNLCVMILPNTKLGITEMPDLEKKKKKKATWEKKEFLSAFLRSVVSLVACMYENPFVIVNIIVCT